VGEWIHQKYYTRKILYTENMSSVQTAVEIYTSTFGGHAQKNKKSIWPVLKSKKSSSQLFWLLIHSTTNSWCDLERKSCPQTDHRILYFGCLKQWIEIFLSVEYLQDVEFKNDPQPLFKDTPQKHACGSCFLLWMSDREKWQVNFMYQSWHSFNVSLGRADTKGKMFAKDLH